MSAATVNEFGYDERAWGPLEQWQTLHAETKATHWYAGFDKLSSWHPYEDLPRLSLSRRFKSFSDRLSRAQEKRH